MSSTVVTILSSCGGVVGALLTFLGVRFTQRQTAQAQKITADIERSKVEASAYTEARQVWDSLIKDLREQSDRQKAELSDLRREVETQHATSERWRHRLEDLEQKRAGDRYAIHTLTSYVRRLLRQIEDNNLVPPPPPEGLDLSG